MYRFSINIFFQKNEGITKKILNKQKEALKVL